VDDALEQVTPEEEEREVKWRDLIQLSPYLEFLTGPPRLRQAMSGADPQPLP
jgi:hypothetical protein